MKTIGILGGMSWESTQSYYRIINEGVKQKMGGLHSAKVILNSIDFGDIEPLMRAGDWQEIIRQLTAALQVLEKAKADFIVISTNTMHKIAEELQSSIAVPILHIADAVGESLQRDNRKTAGLLGTSFTMEQHFYSERITERYGIDVIVPDKKDRNIINKIIFDELCQGKVTTAAKQEYLRIIAELADQGAEGIILGCTEIGMLIAQSDTEISLYDSLVIHAQKAIDTALSKSG